MNGLALYNEIDGFAADWLENLIAAGHIANGRVDRRSITELTPNDCRGAGETHFFAGIGVWSYALRLAGWPSDAPVWTGSCPCQPFSQAGKRGGANDARHLWPTWFKLISKCRPPVVFGEQVAGLDGLEWLDAVCLDLEGAGYAVGAADLSAAGVGAPHIRQRLYFVAHSEKFRLRPWRPSETRWREAVEPHRLGAAGGMAYAATFGRPKLNADLEQEPHRGDPDGRSPARELGDASGEGLSAREPEAVRRAGRREEGRTAQQSGGALRGMGNARGDRAGQHARELQGDEGQHEERGEDGDHSPVAAGATRGFWANAEWIPCSDGVSRPVEPGAFPLAHGAPARVGRLRAYGNAINAEVAATFVRAVMEAM